MRPDLHDWRDVFPLAQLGSGGERARPDQRAQPTQCDTIVASRKAKFGGWMGVFYHARDAFFTPS